MAMKWTLILFVFTYPLSYAFAYSVDTGWRPTAYTATVKNTVELNQKEVLTKETQLDDGTFLCKIKTTDVFGKAISIPEGGQYAFGEAVYYQTNSKVSCPNCGYVSIKAWDPTGRMVPACEIGTTGAVSKTGETLWQKESSEILDVIGDNSSLRTYDSVDNRTVAFRRKDGTTVEGNYTYSRFSWVPQSSGKITSDTCVNELKGSRLDFRQENPEPMDTFEIQCNTPRFFGKKGEKNGLSEGQKDSILSLMNELFQL